MCMRLAALQLLCSYLLYWLLLLYMFCWFELCRDCCHKLPVADDADLWWLWGMCACVHVVHCVQECSTVFCVYFFGIIYNLFGATCRFTKTHIFYEHDEMQKKALLQKQFCLLFRRRFLLHQHNYYYNISSPFRCCWWQSCCCIAQSKHEWWLYGFYTTKFTCNAM